MRDLLPFVVVGITTGSLYGLAGVGLVLTFKTSGVFNFAHGAIAAAAAYVFYDVRYVLHLPWPVAAFVSVCVLGPVLGVAIELIVRQLGDALTVVSIVATVGILLALQGFLSWHYGPLTLAFPEFLPQAGFQLGGVTVRASQVITVALGLMAAGSLYVFLRVSRLGKAMRAIVDDPSLLALSGMRPGRVRAAAWMLGSTLAAATGILIAPFLGRDPVLLTLLVVQAFGAAAIGRFSNLPLTYVGGVVVGVLGALATKYGAGRSYLEGLPTSVPFLVLFVALIVTPKGSLRLGSVRRLRARTGQRSMPPRSLAVMFSAVVVALLFVPVFAGPKLPVYINGLSFFFVFLSLALLLWTSGQISLCHAAFVALGATSFSHLTHGLGVPWLPALLLAGLSVVPLGALVALPAIRLSGVYLALATFGFGVLMQRMVYGTGLMFGVNGFRSAPRFDLAFLDGNSDRSLYYAVLALAVAASVLVICVARSRLGRLLRGLAESPVALVTHGLDVNVTRLLIFCLSASLAGVGGALFVSLSGQISGDGFGPLNSLLWVAVLAIFGRSLLGSPLMAAAAVAVAPAYAPGGFGEYQTMLFGAVAIAAAVLASRTFDWSGRMTDPRAARSPVRERTRARLGVQGPASTTATLVAAGRG